MFIWFKRRRARALTIKLLKINWEFYAINYGEEYREIPIKTECRESLIVELFIFRFWVTQFAYRLFKPKLVEDDEILGFIIHFGLTRGYAMFQLLNGHINVEEVCGEPLSQIVESRFRDYEKVVTSWLTSRDRVILRCSEVLAHHLVEAPEPELETYLFEKTAKQVREIFECWEAGGRA